MNDLERERGGDKLQRKEEIGRDERSVRRRKGEGMEKRRGERKK